MGPSPGPLGTQILVNFYALEHLPMDQKQPGNLIDLIILSKICPFGTTLGPSQGALGTQSLVKNLLSCRALPSGPETSKNPYGLNPTF